MRSNFLTSTFQQISNEWVLRRRERIENQVKTAKVVRRRRLMCVLAHPDDEALCVGGTLAKYAAEGVEIALVVATRGERGWRGTAASDPGLRRMGEIREAELRAAAKVLGVGSVRFLEYVDGEVDAAPFDEVVGRIVDALRWFRPDVVITFDPHGMYGHPDHVVISQATTNAVMLAAVEGKGFGRGSAPHRVAKLYYRVFADEALAAYQGLFGELRMRVGDVERGATGWREWNVTTRMDVRAEGERVWRAIACHKSQMVMDEGLREGFRRVYGGVLGQESFYRVLGCGNIGRGVKTDLFEGVEVRAAGEFVAVQR